MLSALALLVAAQSSGDDAFLQGLSAAVKAGNALAIHSAFAVDKDSAYLFQMARERGGLKNLKVAMIPAPPGWVNRGEYFAIFHTMQDIEEDHDPVYEVHRTAEGLKLGKEVPEDDLGGWRIRHLSYSATLKSKTRQIEVDVDLRLKKGITSRAPLFRLNDCYRLSSKQLLVADETKILKPKVNDLVRAGSLIIPWTSKPSLEYLLMYSGSPKLDGGDDINDSHAYITAWWLPSLGRLPLTVDGTVIGPKSWTIRGEGSQSTLQSIGTAFDHSSNKRKAGEDFGNPYNFICDLPISYPKIIAGKYTLVASARHRGQNFKIFQEDPIDKVKAQVDLDAMIKAADFYQSHFRKLPFNGYECYDSNTYYGVESYSHTILKKSITHYISHEMGHTYFGGYAPCPYVHDSWNEGLTQYIDSVVLLKNKDKTLEAGYSSRHTAIALTDISAAHSYGGVSYWRGAYLMKMLESEIGPDTVMAALRSISQNHVGSALTWPLLRKDFENVSHQKLDWFWDQWISNYTFPTISADHVSVAEVSGGYATTFAISQSGTSSPFKLRFELAVNAGTETKKQMVKLDVATASVTVLTKNKPTGATLNCFPYTLASSKPIDAAWFK